MATKKLSKNCEIVKKIKTVLGTGQSRQRLRVGKMEGKVLVNDLHLLTLKPILYIYNISDKNMELPEELEKKNHVLLDIKTEEDLMEMSEADKKNWDCKAI